MSSTMRAIVIHEAGGPSALKIHNDWPKPTPEPGQVLIRVKAFGLNRSEMFTRQGHSPGVAFPRILGIEAVGIVEGAPSHEFAPGDRVVTLMGGMGRIFDGGYAEYTCVPAKQVLKIQGEYPWELLGAIPEAMHVVQGSLFGVLKLQKGDTLLVRGATSGVGLAAVAVAKAEGARVLATTRSARREALLKKVGADEVIIDDGAIVDKVKALTSGGADKVLDFVGVASLRDTWKCARRGGYVCNAGIAGGKWELDRFNPSVDIPMGVYVSHFGSNVDIPRSEDLEQRARQLHEGSITWPIRTFKFDEIVQAHQVMDDSQAEGKIVVLVD